MSCKRYFLLFTSDMRSNDLKSPELKNSFGTRYFPLLTSGMRSSDFKSLELGKQATKTTSDTRTKSAGSSHPLQAGLGGGKFC